MLRLISFLMLWLSSMGGVLAADSGEEFWGPKSISISGSPLAVKKIKKRSDDRLGYKRYRVVIKNNSPQHAEDVIVAIDHFLPASQFEFFELRRKDGIYKYRLIPTATGAYIQIPKINKRSKKIIDFRFINENSNDFSFSVSATSKTTIPIIDNIESIISDKIFSGTKIRLNGKGFRPTSSVKIAGIPLNKIEYLSSDILEVTVPFNIVNNSIEPLQNGPIDVQVDGSSPFLVTVNSPDISQNQGLNAVNDLIHELDVLAESIRANASSTEAQAQVSQLIDWLSANNALTESEKALIAQINASPDLTITLIRKTLSDALASLDNRSINVLGAALAEASQKLNTGNVAAIPNLSAPGMVSVANAAHPSFQEFLFQLGDFLVSPALSVEAGGVTAGDNWLSLYLKGKQESEKYKSVIEKTRLLSTSLEIAGGGLTVVSLGSAAPVGAGLVLAGVAVDIMSSPFDVYVTLLEKIHGQVDGLRINSDYDARLTPAQTDDKLILEMVKGKTAQLHAIISTKNYSDTQQVLGALTEWATSKINLFSKIADLAKAMAKTGSFANQYGDYEKLYKATKEYFRPSSAPNCPLCPNFGTITDEVFSAEKLFLETAKQPSWNIIREQVWDKAKSEMIVRGHQAAGAIENLLFTRKDFEVSFSHVASTCKSLTIPSSGLVGPLPEIRGFKANCSFYLGEIQKQDSPEYLVEFQALVPYKVVVNLHTNLGTMPGVREFIETSPTSGRTQCKTTIYENSFGTPFLYSLYDNEGKSLGIGGIGGTGPNGTVYCYNHTDETHQWTISSDPLKFLSEEDFGNYTLYIILASSIVPIDYSYNIYHPTTTIINSYLENPKLIPWPVINYPAIAYKIPVKDIMSKYNGNFDFTISYSP
jgi:hypothetical protein